MIALLTILFGSMLYSVAYLYVLGLRIIRQNVDEQTSAVLLASVVSLSLLAATVIKAKLIELMPHHYGQPGAKEGSLLTADVKVGSKYNLGLPCIENNPRTGLYRFVGFRE